MRRLELAYSQQRHHGGASTGLYLGNSDGSAPLVNGIIENNIIVDPIGYGMQIKHQTTWDGEIPKQIESGRTLIRGNLFFKTTRSSSNEQARPNLLLGHAPVSGRGAQSYYDVHSNTLVDNPGEALFQAEGNVVFYNNRLVNRHKTTFPAIAIQPHNAAPRAITIFHNTIVSPHTCVRTISAAGLTEQIIVANALFCDVPVAGGRARANVSAPFALAGDYLTNPFGKAGALDLSPKGDSLAGPKLQIDEARELDAIDVDFDNTARTGRYRGAYNNTGASPRPILLPTGSASPRGPSP